MIPTVGRMVHYVSYGTPGGEYPSVCRAAVITGISENQDSEGVFYVHLFVMNPEGIFLNKDVPEDDNEKRGGTWHWPEREE